MFEKLAAGAGTVARRTGAVALALGLLGVAPALADHDHWREHWHRHYGYGGPRVVVTTPPPVAYYGAPPVYYAPPPPVYYAPPPPVVYPAPGVSLGVTIPLR